MLYEQSIRLVKKQKRQVPARWQPNSASLRHGQPHHSGAGTAGVATISPGTEQRQQPSGCAMMATVARGLQPEKPRGQEQPQSGLSNLHQSPSPQTPGCPAAHRTRFRAGIKPVPFRLAPTRPEAGQLQQTPRKGLASTMISVASKPHCQANASCAV